MSGYVTTPNLGLLKPTYNGDDDQWGNHLNQNADILDGLPNLIGGPFLPLAGNATVTGPTTYTAAAPLTVTATGAATARSVQDHFNDTVSLLDYILPGDPDATAGFGRALARLPTAGPNAGLKILMPAGAFAINSTIIQTIPAGVTLTIEGMGTGVTTVYVGSNVDGFNFTLAYASPRWGGVHLRDLTMVRGPGSPQVSNTAITASADPAAGAQYGGSSSFRNLRIVGGNPGNNQFQNGLVLNSVSGAVVDSVYSLAVNNAGTDLGDVGITLNGWSSSMFGAHYVLDHCSVVGGSCGVNVTGYVQGVFISNSNIIGDYTGIRWYGAGTAVNYTTTAATAAAGTVLTFAANSLGSVNVGDTVNGTNIPVQNMVVAVNNAAGTVTLNVAVTGTGVALGASVAIQPSLHGEELAVVNSTFNASYRGVISSFISYNQISNNTFLRFGNSASDWAAIDLENCVYNNVTGNQVQGNKHATEFGVIVHTDTPLNGGRANAITGNTFIAMGNAGVTLTGYTTATTVTGNVIENSASGITTTISGGNAIVGNMFAAKTLDFTQDSAGNTLLQTPMRISSPGTDPIYMSTPSGNNCRITYLVSGARQWGAGIGSDGGFRITDENIPVDRLLADTSGNITLTGATTVNGNLTTQTTTVGGTAVLEISAPAASWRQLAFASGASLRWLLAANATAEGGGNAGSDFVLYRYTNTGTIIDTPLFIARSSGQLSLLPLINAANDAAAASAGVAVNQLYRNGSQVMQRIV